MVDRRQDVTTRTRIDQIHTDTNAKLTTLKHLIYTFGVLQISTFLIAGYLINDNRGRADRINKSRATNMYNACRDQNQRNIATHRILHKTIQQSVDDGKITPKGGAASEAFTVLLINALAPVRDCNALILDQTKQNPPKNQTTTEDG